MRLILLILSLCVTAAFTENCTGAYFNDKFYGIEILKDGINKIKQLVLNRNDNTLYFIFEQLALQPANSVGYLKIDTKEAGVINGIRNATSLTVDQSYSKVYIGSENGLYAISSKGGNRTAVRLPVREGITSLYFREILYYTNDRHEAFIYENGHVAPMFELQGVKAEKIVLDDDNNIFFTQGKLLFRVKTGTRAINSHEKYRVDVISTDSFNRVYIVERNGVHVYNKYKYVFDRVASWSNVRALTFSKMEEPIYAILDIIFKLNANAVPCSPNHYL